MKKENKAVVCKDVKEIKGFIDGVRTTIVVIVVTILFIAQGYAFHAMGVADGRHEAYRDGYEAAKALYK